MDQTKDCTRELIAKAHNNDKEAREKLVTAVSYTHLLWMIIRLADITKKPAITLIHIDEVLKDKPPAKIILCRGLCCRISEV